MLPHFMSNLYFLLAAYCHADFSVFIDSFGCPASSMFVVVARLLSTSCR